VQLLFGFLLAALIAYGAYRLRSLSGRGALAAVFVGTIVFGLGGGQWAVLLLTFFISSSLLTQAFRKRKQGLSEKFSKGGRRDAGQVFGNGGLAAAFAALHAVFPNEAWPWLGFAAALAAVNADTWATEIGVLSPSATRLITDLGKRVERGSSGGLTLFGTGAALAGSAVIAWLAVSSATADRWTLFLLITAGGLLGSLFDSLLGATVQAMYYCPADQKETEKHPLHTCGTPTVHVRGWRWLDNDWVNVACGAFGVSFVFVSSLILTRI
jgi:uncharacterized protein (TIGR00297 family)